LKKWATRFEFYRVVGWMHDPPVKIWQLNRIKRATLQTCNVFHANLRFRENKNMSECLDIIHQGGWKISFSLFSIYKKNF
jgi:hypothetical protein